MRRKLPIAQGNKAHVHSRDTGSGAAARAKRDACVGQHVQAKAFALDALELEIVPELDHDIITTSSDRTREMLA
ncbi:hypothetical protein G6011_03553 [Alternaria panax]|uniref:Uncharacterized protein n=1 Tax=Alternaria panax TaxID=48097 RepID=A0AAD4IEZ9_9PLEO|nr:hypothetical protein G6011_03553 [Alternaria panax]